MASLRLTFPEKDQPTVIALTGARLTIGRLPFNTIQIIDRTVSGFHAELISEHGHYRLHDRGSSNGTFVNGQQVSDYHLTEACTISFGTVEAQFSPEDVAAVEEAETFPSRGEVNAVRQENAEMRATVSALREEIAALSTEHKSSGESGDATVSRAEYDKLVVEREALKEIQLKQEEELNRFKTDIAILKRDRLNLQLAYDSAQREIEQLKRKVDGAAEEPALPPVQAAAVVAAQADEVRIQVPKPTVPVVAEEAPAAPRPIEATPSIPDTETAETPEPLAPAAHAPFKPVAKPYATLPKAPAAPSAPGIPGAGATPPKPTAPVGLPQKPAGLPKAPGLPPGAVTKPPATFASGVRPLPRPVASNSGGEGQPGTPAVPPRPGQRPLPAARPLPPGAGKPNFTPAPKVGPKGTEKLTP